MSTTPYFISNHQLNGMKIAIVGSSKAQDRYVFVRNTISKLIDEFGKDITIISGGSSGIDLDAKNACTALKLQYKEFAPKSWSKDDLLARNREMAKEADLVVSIALPFDGQACYHCKSDTHQKTAGCYTAKHAKQLGKNTRLLISH